MLDTFDLETQLIFRKLQKSNYKNKIVILKIKNNHSLEV